MSGGCGGTVGLVLIVLPVILFQIDPASPLGRTDWGDDSSGYCKLCTILGGIGGILMSLTRRDGNNSLGYVWAAGMFGGGVTSYLSFIASAQWVTFQDEPNINVFIIMICSMPGLIIFACIKKCSDYTFPEEQYVPVPDHHGPKEYSRRAVTAHNV